MTLKEKKPTAIGGFSEVAKTPREQSFSVTEQNPTWKLGRLDFGGPFCPKNLSKDKLLEIVTKLGHLEKQTWDELRKKGCHQVQVSNLAKKARDRLKDLKLDDWTEIYSIRLSGQNRVWGLRIVNAVLVLWWDPDHQICPSEKKNT